MDDNGESYWIFESRDVRSRLFLPSLLHAEQSHQAFAACQSCRLSVSVSPRIPSYLSLNLFYLRDYFGLHFTSSRPSGLVFFSYPCSSLIYRGSSELHYVVCLDLTCLDGMQIHPHCCACPRLQYYKCDWIHLRVRTLHIFLLNLTRFPFIPR